MFATGMTSTTETHSMQSCIHCQQLCCVGQ